MVKLFYIAELRSHKQTLYFCVVQLLRWHHGLSFFQIVVSPDDLEFKIFVTLSFFNVSTWNKNGNVEHNNGSVIYPNIISVSYWYSEILASTQSPIAISFDLSEIKDTPYTM